MGQILLALVAGYFACMAYHVHNKESYIEKLAGDVLIVLVCIVVIIWKNLVNL